MNRRKVVALIKPAVESSLDSNSDIRCIEQRSEINNHCDWSVGGHISDQHCMLKVKIFWIILDYWLPFGLERLRT